MSKKTTSLDSQARGESPQAEPLCFLVVDDDALNRNMMELMLAPRGYQLHFACDGTEALEAVKARSFDLIFMDLVLPDMSGRDVSRRIREWEAGKRHVPIVAVTAYDTLGQPLEMARAGIDDYIFKPYDLRGLSRIIQLYANRDGNEASEPGSPVKTLPGPEVPVLDIEGSLLDFSHDVDGYKELLRDFLSSLPQRLEKLKQAHEAGDCERLNRECHTLKGVSAGLGAMRLSRLATQLGRSCVDGQRGSASPLLDQVVQCTLELRAEAQNFLRE